MLDGNADGFEVGLEEGVLLGMADGVALGRLVGLDDGIGLGLQWVGLPVGWPEG